MPSPNLMYWRCLKTPPFWFAVKNSGVQATGEDEVECFSTDENPKITPIYIRGRTSTKTHGIQLSRGSLLRPRLGPKSLGVGPLRKRHNGANSQSGSSFLKVRLKADFAAYRVLFLVAPGPLCGRGFFFWFEPQRVLPSRGPQPKNPLFVSFLSLKRFLFGRF